MPPPHMPLLFPISFSPIASNEVCLQVRGAWSGVAGGVCSIVCSITVSGDRSSFVGHSESAGEDPETVD